MCSCNMDCFNCPHDDCINDCMSESQYRYNHSDKGRESRKRYESSEKGRATAKRYADSEKGKEARKRYASSEKGRASEKRKNAKKIASGKNAEACRRYYARKKAEKEQNVLKS